MGILDGIKRQLRSVIQWDDPDPNALFERWTDNGDEIKNASKLIVGPGQGCIFVHEGKVQGVYTEEGIVELKTSNIPFITTIKKIMQSFESEHKVGIYFFRKTQFLNQKWGTPSMIKYEDPKYKFPVGLRSFGNYTFRIVDAGSFFVNVMGGTDAFYVDDIREPINSRLVQPLTDYLATSKFTYTEIDANREEIASGLSEKFRPEFTKLGFELNDFRVEGTSFDEDTMRRINRIADMSAEAQAADAAGVSFAQMQQLAALRDAAKNEGAGGMAMAMGVGMGFGGVAQQTATQPATDDPAVKLKKLKGLLDQGLITQEEFDAKKKEILSQM
jgi:membrane protease subunit (stomatin/prohibitin family)